MNSPPPLKPVVFQILLVLMDGERHGYGIVKDVESRSHGAIRVEPANLYRTLRTLLAKGFIEESEERPDPELDDERRRYFRITSDGVRAARAEADRLEQLVNAARSHDLLTR